MKKLIYVFALGALVAVSSCKKEDDVEPVETTTTTTTTTVQKDEYRYNYKTAAGGNTEFEVTKCATAQEMLDGQQLHNWYNIRIMSYNCQ